MNVVWSETAALNLEEIRNHLFRVDPDYDQAVVERIVSRADDLVSCPFIGAEVPEYDDDRIREIFESPYRILYRVIESEIRVMAVIRASRPLPRMPPD